MWGTFYVVSALLLQAGAAGVARLVCYVDTPAQGLTECTHVVYAGDVRGDKLDAVLKEIRKGSTRAKIVVRVGGEDKVSLFFFLRRRYKYVQLYLPIIMNKNLLPTKLISNEKTYLEVRKNLPRRY